ncbi:MAG: hypothetical protein JST51_09095 [Armatimonadetes bacterium]|nr:hypothetical protein [Armatimonadota bacterium]
MLCALAIVFSGSLVSIENPGVRLELFLKELSRQAGEEFHCPPFLKNEVLAASFSNQPVEAVKARLATVLHAEWSQKEDGWWLGQSGKQQQEEKDWNRQARQTIIQMELDGLKAKAPKAEWTAGEAEQYWQDFKDSHRRTGEGVWSSARRRELRMRSPDYRFVENLASLLKPSMFSFDGLAPDYSEYAVNGLPGQIPLKIDLSEPLEQFQREVELSRSMQATDTQRTEHVVFSFTRLVDVPCLNAVYFDKNWESVGGALGGFFALLNLKIEGEAFPLSKELQDRLQFRARLNRTFEEDQLVGLRKSPLFLEGAKVMENAVTTDPLGIVEGPCWIDFAHSVSKPLLVSLEEDKALYRPANFVVKMGDDAAPIGMTRVDEDGWVLGRPKNPLENRTWRLDRQLVQDLARSSAASDHDTLLAKLHQIDIYYYASVFAYGVPNEAYIPNGFDYGSPTAVLGPLSKEQLDYCLKGGWIPSASLPERSQKYLEDLVWSGALNHLSPLNLQDPDACPARLSMPNGIEGISIGARQEDQYIYYLDGDSDPVGYLEVAGRLKDGSLKESQTFQMEEKHTLTAVFRLGEKEYETELDVPAKPKASYTMKTLPEAARAQIVEALKAIGVRN